MNLEPYLIASLLNNPAGILEIDLKAEDFADDLYGYTYEKMRKLYGEKQSFSLADFLKDLPSENFQHIRELSANAVSSRAETIRDYAVAVRQDTEKRLILGAILDITPDMSLTEIRQRLSIIGQSEATATKIKTAEKVLSEIKESLELPPACFSSGLKCLDEAMGGGFYESFVYGFAGAEKSGKTTLGHTISYNLEQNGCKHLYVALEMGAKYIEQRNIGRELGFNSLSFLNAREKIKPRMGSVKAKENTLYLDAPGATFDEIITELSKAVVGYGIKGVIIDYWQLVQGENYRNTEEKHLRNVAQGFADFAKKNGIFVILLAQMNQQGNLFGGGGLRKACEQLYMIKFVERVETMRWLEMDSTRYTVKVNVGSEASPALVLEQNSGPFFREVKQ